MVDDLMENDICRRHLSREGIGCVWVFMHIFGGSNQKLLMNKKHGSKRILGIQKQFTYDSDSEETEVGMQSVKKLIEEEIDDKTKARNQNMGSRTCSKASDDNDDHAEKVESLDDDTEEKFSELIKRLIDQKENEVESSSCQYTQTIVILKPQTFSPDVGSSPGVDSTKGKSRRFGSRFLLRGIRRLIGKNSCNAQQQGSVPDNRDAVSLNEEDIEIESMRHEKRMSGIYITAKKHLSDMLAEGDMDVDPPSDKEVPKILGKILALSEYSTPTTSPRLTLDSNKYEDIEKEEEEKTIIDWSCEDELKKHLEKVTSDERHSPCSPPRCQENATDVPGKLSPVSVLEPLFTDDELSPNTSNFSSVEMRLKPRCIIFDESNKKNDNVDDKELILAYIQAVMESSELNWEELLSRSYYSDQILEQALMDQIDFSSTNLCDNNKLLFECINEVLIEFSKHGPWVSFVKPAVRLENAIKVVQEEVYWHLLPLPSPHTLGQIVQKDYVRTDNWMDLRFDVGCIGYETGEIILDELLKEIISH